MSVTITENAAKEILRVIEDDKRGEDIVLRVGVKGGG